jgi:hypothetical protein
MYDAAPFVLGLPAMYYFYLMQGPDIAEYTPAEAGGRAVEARMRWKRNKDARQTRITTADHSLFPSPLSTPIRAFFTICALLLVCR